MQSGPSSRTAREVRPRYEPLRAGGFREPAWVQIVAAATAPVGGSKRLFPRRLAEAMAAHVRGEPASIQSPHARWFFGDSLVFWTDPARLTERLLDKVHDGAAAIRLAARFLDSGDWRDVIRPVAELGEHEAMQELVEHGGRYAETPSFELMMQGVKRKRPVRRYRSRLDTEEKVHAYFRYFLQLTESIREHGFREQAGLPGVSPPSGVEVRGTFALRQRNIGVAIGADGRLMRFLGGRHRVAIAQALGVPAVPVELRLVHLDWLAEEMRRSGLPPAIALKQWARSASTPPPPASAQPGREQRSGGGGGVNWRVSGPAAAPAG